jgi:hypothetical protein
MGCFLTSVHSLVMLPTQLHNPHGVLHPRRVIPDFCGDPRTEREAPHQREDSSIQFAWLVPKNTSPDHWSAPAFSYGTTDTQYDAAQAMALISSPSPLNFSLALCSW